MSNLYNKYIVQKSDGSPVDPNAQYFVLRIDTDPAARHAVLMYAYHIGAEDPQFAEQLRNWVLSYQEGSLTPDAADLANAARENGGILEDGFGNITSIVCSNCGGKTMQVVRPGKFQCVVCG